MLQSGTENRSSGFVAATLQTLSVNYKKVLACSQTESQVSSVDRSHVVALLAQHLQQQSQAGQ